MDTSNKTKFKVGDIVIRNGVYKPGFPYRGWIGKVINVLSDSTIELVSYPRNGDSDDEDSEAESVLFGEDGLIVQDVKHFDLVEDKTFYVGEKVVANKYASQYYSITKRGWIGTVYRVYPNDKFTITVKSDRGCNYHVYAYCFDPIDDFRMSKEDESDFLSLIEK